MDHTEELQCTDRNYVRLRPFPRVEVLHDAQNHVPKYEGRVTTGNRNQIARTTGTVDVEYNTKGRQQEFDPIAMS